MEDLFFTVLALVVVLLLLAIGWRYFVVRTKGIPVSLRPAEEATDGHHWRHGVMVFSMRFARCYSVPSLRPYANKRFSRHDIEILGRRDATEAEFAKLGPVRIMNIAVDDKNYQLGVSTAADTALVSWLESAPDIRMERLSAPASVRTRRVR